jgi:hypothetical protein
MHVADHDTGKVARIEDVLETPDDPLADVEQDRRPAPLEEVSGSG